MDENKVQIFIGSKVEHASERTVLETVCDILHRQHVEAIVIANINLNGRQIDLVVALDQLTLVVEAKGFSRPIRGGENGDWQVRLASGDWKDFPNPYVQALSAAHALRDAMRAFCGHEIDSYPRSALIFVPHIPADSLICPGDFKVSICGLESIDQELNRKQGCFWDLNQWLKFVSHHRITPISTLGAAFDPGLLHAEDIVTKYNDTFIQTYLPACEQIVDFYCSKREERISSGEVICQVTDDKIDLLLKGPSGCGKSILAYKIGIEWINQGGVTVIIQPKNLTSSLKEVLNREVALLGAPSAAKLLHAAQQAERPLLFVLDGYNECHEVDRTYLTRGMAGLLRLYGGHLLVTSQIPLVRPDLLKLHEFEVMAPTDEMKYAIAEISSGHKISPEADFLLHTVQTGLEATLIGEVGQGIARSSSRYAIFDAFARKRLGTKASEGIRVLSRVAGLLSDRVSFTLSIRDLDRLLDAENLPISLLPDLQITNLLSWHGHFVSFSHELFYNAFTAEAVLRRSRGNVDTILKALLEPRFAECKDMIVGAIDDDVLLQQVLNNVADSNVISSCLAGLCGEYAKRWAEIRISEVIERIEEEARKLTFLVTGEGALHVSIDRLTLQSWSKEDLAFISCIPELLTEGRHVDQMIEIVGVMDDRIANETIRLKVPLKKEICLKNDIFANCYVFHHDASAGITKVFNGIQSSLFRRKPHNQLKSAIRGKIEDRKLTIGQIYLLLHLCNSIHDRDTLPARQVKEMIERFWSKSPYHLQLELMQTARYCWDADESERDDLIKTIDGLSWGGNILISTEIIETLQCLGALEESEAEHQQEVRDMVADCLSWPETTEKCTTAYQVYYRQFDHPLSRAYWETVSELSDSDRKRLLVLAAKGTPDTNFFISPLIIDITSFNDPVVGEIVDRWTAVPPADNFMPQEAIEIFFIAHICLGRLGCSLLKPENVEVSARALAACGNVLFWLNRVDLTEADRRSKCMPALKVLQENCLVAVDALRLCEHARLFAPSSFRGGETIEFSVSTFFPEECSFICRMGLKSPDMLTGHFRFFDRIQALKFCLSVLGQHGNEGDLTLLRQLTSDLQLGSSSISAMKAIEKRSQTRVPS